MACVGPVNRPLRVRRIARFVATAYARAPRPFSLAFPIATFP